MRIVLSMQCKWRTWFYCLLRKECFVFQKLIFLRHLWDNILLLAQKLKYCCSSQNDLGWRYVLLSTCVGFASILELKEQLLARASQVEEIERLKQEFEQQHQQRKSEHETELEQLRLYFENKLRVAEENYREELTLLHQRLQELKEYSLSELEMSQDQAGDIRWSILFPFISCYDSMLLFYIYIYKRWC